VERNIVMQMEVVKKTKISQVYDQNLYQEGKGSLTRVHSAHLGSHPSQVLYVTIIVPDSREMAFAVYCPTLFLA
jgi:hypothetical protein